MQKSYDSGNFLRRSWKEDGERTPLVNRHRVALIDQQFRFVREDGGWSDNLSKRIENRPLFHGLSFRACQQ